MRIHRACNREPSPTGWRTLNPFHGDFIILMLLESQVTGIILSVCTSISGKYGLCESRQDFTGEVLEGSGSI